MKRFRILIVLIFVLSLAFGSILIAKGSTDFAEAEDADGCTGAIAVGNVSSTTLVGQNWDTGYPWPQVFGLRMTTNEETGIKVIWDARYRKVPRLSSEGVTHTQNARTSPGAFTWKSETGNEKTLYGLDYGHAILGKAHSAKEAIQMAEEIAKEYGVRSGTGGAKMYGDPYEVYLIEGNGPDQYDVMQFENEAVAHANAYLSPKLKPTLESNSSGLARMQSMARLLALRDNTGYQFGSARGNIDTEYFMSLFRYHVWEWEDIARPMNKWEVGMQGDYGNICRWGATSGSTFASFAELPKSNTDMFSIFWTTAGIPHLGPYLPFFIGIPKIPPSFAVGEENQTKVFAELDKVVRFNLNYGAEVELFWQAFDRQTILECKYVKIDAKALIDEGKKDEAGMVLYDYVENRCDQAIKYAQELTKAINEKGLVKINAEIFYDWPEPPADYK